MAVVVGKHAPRDERLTSFSQPPQRIGVRPSDNVLPFIVAIEAGHGTVDAKGRLVSVGTSGTYKGALFRECDLTLEYSEVLATALETRGIELARDRTFEHPSFRIPFADYSSEKANRYRATLTNASHADIWIRLHLDGGSGVQQGTVIYRNDMALKDASKLEQESSLVANYIVGRVQASGRPCTMATFKRPIYGFMYCEIPSVLIEIGFIKTPSEMELIQDSSFKLQFCDALASGILDYLLLSRKGGRP